MANYPNLISAKIVADSINQQGDRITTFELVFPRFILAELNTHRLFTKNSASSRAIPFHKMVTEVMERPFVPIAWQKHHSGMQGTQYHDHPMYLHALETGWLRARDKMVEEAELLYHNCGLTKQLVNRMLEPFLYHKVLLTATEFENFFNLRSPQYSSPVSKTIEKQFSFTDLKNNHSNEENLKLLEELELTQRGKLSLNDGMAEIHIMDLAEKMWDAYNESEPLLLLPGHWHIPYKPNRKEIKDFLFLESGEIPTPKEITKASIKIATARCARLSYQTLGDTPKIDFKADLNLFESLKSSEHWSPYEHCAKAMNEKEYFSNVKGDLHEFVHRDTIDGQLFFREIFEQEMTKEDSYKFGWSRNFKGFIQLRSLLD